MSNCVNGDDKIEGAKELGEMRGAVRKYILFREDFGGETQESCRRQGMGGALGQTPEIVSDSGSREGTRHQPRQVILITFRAVQK